MMSLGIRYRHDGTRNPSWLPVLILVLVLFSPMASADYQSGLDAYNAARYTTAMDEWKAVVARPAETVNTGMYAEAHYGIGMLYWLGQGVIKDYVEASGWFRKAAELGSSGAQGKLGYMYSRGVVVDRDPVKAFEWFRKAARQGDVDGQYNLGIFYLNGWGTKKDKTMAAQYLAAASAQGDEDAEAMLGQVLAQIADDKRHTDNNRHPGLENVMPGYDPVPESSSAITSMGNGSRIEPGTTTAEQSGMTEPESFLLPTTWILQQNPQHYTIQVIGLSTVKALEKLVKGHGELKQFATYTLIRHNKPLYMLVLGDYPDVASARAAVAHFPVSIQKRQELWIRRFERIQQLIRAEQGHSGPTAVRHSGPTIVHHSGTGPTIVRHSGPTIVRHSGLDPESIFALTYPKNGSRICHAGPRSSTGAKSVRHETSP